LSRCTVGVLLFACLAVAAADAATLLHAGKLIDGVSKQPRERVTVVIEGNRIAAIEPGFRAGTAQDRVIDLGQATLLPGLMDMHVHITEENAPGYELARFKKAAADYAFDGTVYAARTLQAGFTTVRDTGDILYNVSLSLRNAINAGKVIGPRIYAAGRIIATTGGHGDSTNGWGPHLLAIPGIEDSIVDGPAEAMRAARRHYKDGTDVIKITVTGGVLSIAKSGMAPQFSDEELRAVITTAHDYGMTVAAHAHGLEGMTRAVRAGVDSIEHGTFMDRDLMELMKKSGTHYVATISAGRWVYEQAQKPGAYPDVVRQGTRDRPADPEDLRRGLPRRRARDVRHRRRGLSARVERARVPVHGGSRHARDGGHPVGDHRAGALSQDRRPPGEH
jgi:imidazolonepropionase-like amidohydrolase